MILAGKTFTDAAQLQSGTFSCDSFDWNRVWVALWPIDCRNGKAAILPLWSAGLAKYKSQHLDAFTRDPKFRGRFIGRPIETLRPLFPNLHSGRMYSSDSYRHESVQGSLKRASGVTKEDYWLDGDENAFGYCVLVVDGKIHSFFFVKG
jgi:hypothetical protein